MADYLETLNNKRQTAAADSTKKQDTDQMIEQLKQIQLSALLGAQGKSTVILTDQTDLGDKLKEAMNTIASTIKQLDSSDHDSKELSALNELQTALSGIKTVNPSEATKMHRELIAAVKAITVAPVVNVPEVKLPAPTVKVTENKVDFKPLQDTIKEYFKAPETEEKVDLECYRAQDILNDGDMQYVGFVNPDGNWYIIENDTKGNKLRYVFGKKGYKTAFKKASTYKYSLLNEAVNAL